MIYTNSEFITRTLNHVIKTISGTDVLIQTIHHKITDDSICLIGVNDFMNELCETLIQQNIRLYCLEKQSLENLLFVLMLKNGKWVDFTAQYITCMIHSSKVISSTNNQKFISFVNNESFKNLDYYLSDDEEKKLKELLSIFDDFYSSNIENKWSLSLQYSRILSAFENYFRSKWLITYDGVC